MLKSLPQILFTCTPDGKVEWVSAYWYTYTGSNEFSGALWSECQQPEDRESLRGRWQELTRAGGSFLVEFRLLRADGMYCWHVAHLAPLRDASGGIVHWLGSANEVHALRTEAELQEQLKYEERASPKQADLANHLKDDFLATVAHELRNPVANIIMWVRVLLAQYSHYDAGLKRGLSLLGSNAAAQLQLIDDMLDFERIVRGMVSLELTELNLQTFIEDCCDSHRPAAASRGLVITSEFHIDQIAAVRADVIRLQQIVGNLLSNAFKFTPCGGEIHVGVRVSGECYEIRVRDSGEGIPVDAIDSIFGRFYKGSSTAVHGQSGLGLGLAIVRQLVLLHGGQVSATSAGPGLGATFEVHMPVDPPAGCDGVVAREGLTLSCA